MQKLYHFYSSKCSSEIKVKEETYTEKISFHFKSNIFLFCFRTKLVRPSWISHLKFFFATIETKPQMTFFPICFSLSQLSIGTRFYLSNPPIIFCPVNPLPWALGPERNFASGYIFCCFVGGSLLWLIVDFNLFDTYPLFSIVLKCQMGGVEW